MPDCKSEKERLEKRISGLEKELAETRETAGQELAAISARLSDAIDEMARQSRLIYTIRATADMPELYIDQDLRIVAYSGNFPSLTRKIGEFAAQNRIIDDLLTENACRRIRKHQQNIRRLANMDYSIGGKWLMRYSGPNAEENIGNQWVRYNNSQDSHWSLEEVDGRTCIIHRPHIDDDLDCYLMTAEEFDGAEEDLRVDFTVRTADDDHAIRDLSLVIAGGAGNGEIMPDLLGYTVCSGSSGNSEARI